MVLLADLAPAKIVELGIFRGGSTAMFAPESRQVARKCEQCIAGERGGRR